MTVFAVIILFGPDSFVILVEWDWGRLSINAYMLSEDLLVLALSCWSSSQAVSLEAGKVTEMWPRRWSDFFYPDSASCSPEPSFKEHFCNVNPPSRHWKRIPKADGHISKWLASCLPLQSKYVAWCEPGFFSSLTFHVELQVCEKQSLGLVTKCTDNCGVGCSGCHVCGVWRMRCVWCGICVVWDEIDVVYVCDASFC